jgi:transcriptional regulator with XRE-family HTH domain
MSEVALKSAEGEIGKVLRLAREKSARNLGEIALQAEISISMLSQIERGIVSPSIDTLLRVCQALELDAGELFRRISPKPGLKLVHKGKRLSTETGGVKYEQLSSASEAGIAAEMFLMEVRAGAGVGMSNKGHEGVELGYMLAGSAVLIVDGKEYEVRAGDSVTFSAHLPHRLENRGDELFQSIWTALPPHKDYFEHETGK